MKPLVVLGVLIAALLAPAAASAHPLGNFTINQFARIQPSGDRVYVLYVLDMAEIPTFQARDEVAAKGRETYAANLAAQLGQRLTLLLNGHRELLRELRHAIAFPKGAAGLETTRLEILFETDPLPAGKPVALSFANTNYGSRIGWREIVIAPEAGARVSGSSAPGRSISDELRAYPRDLLQSPLDVRTATAGLTPGEIAGPPPTLLDGTQLQAPARVASRSDQGFAALVSRDHLSTSIVLVSLLVALFWGMVHALSPGHGKTIVAAYLVGTRGTARQAVYLGGIVTITHTIGVFALGFVTLALSQFVVPDTLYPWLNFGAALLVVIVGVGVLRSRLREWAARRRPTVTEAHHHDGHEHAHDHDHPHTHDHGHPHGHSHDHAPKPGTGWRGLLGIGISGGLLPCPSALVVLLASISLHRIGYGLVLILAFSLGLAGTITGIGLVAVNAKRVFARASFQGRLVRALPAVSAVVILAFGITMTIRAVPHVF